MLTIAVSSPDGSAPQLEIEDALGRSVFETEPNNGVSAGSVRITTGITLFIRIRAKDRATSAYVADLSLA
jgi:hypothetical protein